MVLVGVAALSADIALFVLEGERSVSFACIEPCDSASISVDVISSMPRNVVDGVVADGGGDDDAAVAATAAVAGCCGGGGTVVGSVCVGTGWSGLVALSGADGGGVGDS